MTQEIRKLTADQVAWILDRLKAKADASISAELLALRVADGDIVNMTWNLQVSLEVNENNTVPESITVDTRLFSRIRPRKRDPGTC